MATLPRRLNVRLRALFLEVNLLLLLLLLRPRPSPGPVPPARSVQSATLPLRLSLAGTRSLFELLRKKDAVKPFY